MREQIKGLAELKPPSLYLQASHFNKNCQLNQSSYTQKQSHKDFKKFRISTYSIVLYKDSGLKPQLIFPLVVITVGK